MDDKTKLKLADSIIAQAFKDAGAVLTIPSINYSLLAERLGISEEDARVLVIQEFHQKVDSLQISDALLDIKLEVITSDTSLNRRILKRLNLINVFTLRDLISKTKTELLRIDNFGMTSLRAVNRFLNEKGLSLKKEE